MAILCRRCGREFDFTLFQFGRFVRCECGELVGMADAHRIDLSKAESPDYEYLSPVPPHVESTRLYLIRHGETDYNRQERIQGQSDIALNERGREQARAIAERLSGEAIDIIYTSDLSRAIETAEIITDRTGAEIVAEPALRETNYGEWEGKTRHELLQLYPREVEFHRRDAFNYAPPSGEPRKELMERVVECLEDVVRKEKGKRVAVVTHTGPCYIFVHYVLGVAVKARSPFRIENGSITIIERCRGWWELVLLNDTSHLDSV